MLFISDLDLHPRSSLRLGDARAATVGDLRRPQDPQKPADVREELSGAVKVEAVPGRECSSGAPVALLGGKCGIRSPLKRVSPWHSCRSHSELSVRDSGQSPGPGQRAGAPGSPPWHGDTLLQCPVPTGGGSGLSPLRGDGISEVLISPLFHLFARWSSQQWCSCCWPAPRAQPRLRHLSFIPVCSFSFLWEEARAAADQPRALLVHSAGFPGLP